MKQSEPTGRVLFEEKQSYPRWLAILLLSPVLVIVGISIAFAFADPADRAEMLIAMVIVIPVQLVLLYLFYVVRLHKIVTSDGVYFRWLPVQKKFRVIRKEEIASVEIRKGPALKYGPGWLPHYGKLYTVSSGTGLQLHFRDGKKGFFGTADTFLFERAVRELVSN